MRVTALLGRPVGHDLFAGREPARRRPARRRGAQAVGSGLLVADADARSTRSGTCSPRTPFASGCCRPNAGACTHHRDRARAATRASRRARAARPSGPRTCSPSGDRAAALRRRCTRRGCPPASTRTATAWRQYSRVVDLLDASIQLRSPSPRWSCWPRPRTPRGGAATATAVELAERAVPGVHRLSRTRRDRRANRPLPRRRRPVRRRRGGFTSRAPNSRPTLDDPALHARVAVVVRPAVAADRPVPPGDPAGVPHWNSLPPRTSPPSRAARTRRSG